MVIIIILNDKKSFQSAETKTRRILLRSTSFHRYEQWWITILRAHQIKSRPRKGLLYYIIILLYNYTGGRPVKEMAINRGAIWRYHIPRLYLLADTKTTIGGSTFYIIIIIVQSTSYYNMV